MAPLLCAIQRFFSPMESPSFTADGLLQSEPLVPVAQVIRLIAGRATESGSALRGAAHGAAAGVEINK